MNQLSKIVNWSEITAIFGGLFDPPHLGHREAVRGILTDPGVKEVIILPTGIPPHKAAVVSVEHRVKMTELNFISTASDPYPNQVKIDLREIEKSLKFPSNPNYTYNTLLEFKQEIPNLAFVVGMDQLISMNSWHRFPQILSLNHWIILKRKPVNDPHLIHTLQQWQGSGLIRFIQEQTWQIQNSKYMLSLRETHAPELSSTQIRETILRTGLPPKNTLFDEVLGYLKSHRLYGINRN